MFVELSRSFLFFSSFVFNFFIFDSFVFDSWVFIFVVAVGVFNIDSDV